MNGIEQHAVLAALLAKYAVEGSGEAGREAFLAGIRRMAYERGARMAVRALQNGDRLDIVSFNAYGEWRAQPGEMEAALKREDGVAVMVVTKCPWNNSWRKHGLIEYGKLYCEVVDDALARGFYPEFHCDVPCTLSAEGHCCRFEWGIPMTAEEEQSLLNKKKALGDRCAKSFDYHVAHVLYSVGDELALRLGQAGVTAVEQAKRAFAELFGQEYLDAAKGAYLVG